MKKEPKSKEKTLCYSLNESIVNVFKTWFFDIKQGINRFQQKAHHDKNKRCLCIHLLTSWLICQNIIGNEIFQVIFKSLGRNKTSFVYWSVFISISQQIFWSGLNDFVNCVYLYSCILLNQSLWIPLTY